MTHPAEDNVAERGMVALARGLRRAIHDSAPTIHDRAATIHDNGDGGTVLQPTQPWNGYDRRIPHAHGDTALVMGQGGVREI